MAEPDKREYNLNMHTDYWDIAGKVFSLIKIKWIFYFSLFSMIRYLIEIPEILLHVFEIV